LARKIHCAISRDGERFGYRVRFCYSDQFHFVSSSYESLARTLKRQDGHRERVWRQPGPSAAADIVLVSDEYKPDSVGWRMEQPEIQGSRADPTLSGIV
jgi:hypothetical protein